MTATTETRTANDVIDALIEAEAGKSPATKDEIRETRMRLQSAIRMSTGDVLRAMSREDPFAPDASDVLGAPNALAREQQAQWRERAEQWHGRRIAAALREARRVGRMYGAEV